MASPSGPRGRGRGTAVPATTPLEPGSLGLTQHPAVVAAGIGGLAPGNPIRSSGRGRGRGNTSNASTSSVLSAPSSSSSSSSSSTKSVPKSASSSTTTSTAASNVAVRADSPYSSVSNATTGLQGVNLDSRSVSPDPFGPITDLKGNVIPLAIREGYNEGRLVKKFPISVNMFRLTSDHKDVHVYYTKFWRKRPDKFKDEEDKFMKTTEDRMQMFRYWREEVRNVHKNVFTGLDLYDGNEIVLSDTIYEPNDLLAVQNPVQFRVPSEDIRFEMASKVVFLCTVQLSCQDGGSILYPGGKGMPRITNHRILSIFLSNLRVTSSDYWWRFGQQSIMPTLKAMAPITDLGLPPLGLSGARQCITGLYASMQIGQNNDIICNMDLSNLVVMKEQSVVDFLCATLNEAEKSNAYQPHMITASVKLNARQKIPLENALKGLKVYTTVGGIRRSYKVRKLTEDPLHTIKFATNKEGTTFKTVVEYFKSQYQVDLKMLGMPCIEAGTKSKPNYLPMELCTIQGGQKSGRDLTDNDKSSMIRGCCLDAARRKDLIEKLAGAVALGEDPISQAYNLRPDVKMMSVEAKLLPPASLEYGRNARVEAQNGEWKTGGKTLLTPTRFEYAIITFVPNQEQTLQRFCQGLHTEAGKMGLQVAPTWTPSPTGLLVVNDAQSAQDMLDHCVSDGNRNKIILVIMERRNSQLYGAIKKKAELDIGVLTQCLLLKTVGRPSASTYANIVFKINAKLGGTNQRIYCDPRTAGSCPIYEPIMDQIRDGSKVLVLGLDVTRGDAPQGQPKRAPGEQREKKPTFGAVVGNESQGVTSFATSMAVCKENAELLTYLVEPFRTRIEQYTMGVGGPPEHIILYRDGVANSAFRAVLIEEVGCLRKACETLGVKPTITVIIVDRHHHVKFFPTNFIDVIGRGKNVQAGTLVDEVITHPTMFDYYLCSHAGIQGCSRPAHYTVLINENPYSSEQLQIFSWQLAHLYAKCPRSVAVPVPVSYADKACERARMLCHDILTPNFKVQVKDALKNKMFYI